MRAIFHFAFLIFNCLVPLVLLAQTNSIPDFVNPDSISTALAPDMPAVTKPSPAKTNFLAEFQFPTSLGKYPPAFNPLTYAPPQIAFIQQSIDGSPWQTVATYPYPTNGGPLSCTNPVNTNALKVFYRAGYY
jgi:hypothetical protein